MAIIIISEGVPSGGMFCICIFCICILYFGYFVFVVAYCIDLSPAHQKQPTKLRARVQAQFRLLLRGMNESMASQHR